jgi:uncharacterized protein
MLILLPPSEKKAAEPGPAITVYTGVLYQGLAGQRWAHLAKTEHRNQSQSSRLSTEASNALISLSPTKKK